MVKETVMLRVTRPSNDKLNQYIRHVAEKEKLNLNKIDVLEFLIQKKLNELEIKRKPKSRGFF